MKRIALLAAIMMFSSGSFAQAQKPPAKEAAKPAAKEAAKPAAKEAAPAAQEAQKPAVVAAKKSRRAEDARHCLERPSNSEIIKCAEAYL
jgi:predicted lipid-binding transport protein (Tim44 family)